jgi:RNA polymerase sigma factor (sigma-70 family)
LDLSDREIIEGFIAGRKKEHEILAQWIRELANIRLRTRRVSADEIVSDTMYRLLIKFRSDSFTLVESLKSYVQAVAWYTIIDHIRYWRKYTDLPDNEGFDPPDPGDISADVEKEENQAIIERVFRLMSGECRKLWDLRFVDDLDYKEIGNRLGISEGNVKIRFHRCKKQAIGIRKRIS